MSIGKPLDLHELRQGTDSLFLNPNSLPLSGNAIEVCDGVLSAVAINTWWRDTSGISPQDIENGVTQAIKKISSKETLTLLAHRVVINTWGLQETIERTKERARARLLELSQQ